MPTINLTDMTIRNLKPGPDRLTYFDVNLTGFGVRVAPSGTKTFTLVYGPTRKRISLGRVGIVSLADARKEARKVLAEHTLGKIRPQAITYQNALDEFLEESGRVNKPRTTADYKRLLTVHFKYGKTPLAEITRQDIKTRLAKLNKTPSEKHHAFVAIRRFMRWAVANQYIEHSPVDGITVAPQKPRERILSPEEHKTVLSRALGQKTMFHSIVTLLILTGQRRGEIGALEWDWIQDDQITLPEWITKNNRVHVFPLGKLAQDVISKIPKTSKYVFPSRVSSGTTFNGWGKSKDSFDEGLEVEPYTLHDLRRTFASTLALLGVPIHVTEKLLNHVSGSHGGIVGVYQRYSYMDEMKEAVGVFEAWLRA